jgi:hypothetical protein
LVAQCDIFSKLIKSFLESGNIVNTDIQGKNMNIAEMLEKQIEILKATLIAGKHLGSDEERREVLDLIQSITMYSGVFSNTDRKFINAAKLALMSRRTWR